MVGVSGAGKSTMVRQWLRADACAPGARILSDDRVIVRFCDDGPPLLFGTPWHGEERYCDRGGVPLAGWYLLAKATDGQNSIDRSLAPAALVAQLVCCTFGLFHCARRMGRTLALCERLVTAVPCGVLRFAPTPAVVEAVLSASMGPGHRMG
jgi:hypothetical protein